MMYTEGTGKGILMIRTCIVGANAIQCSVRNGAPNIGAWGVVFLILVLVIAVSLLTLAALGTCNVFHHHAQHRRGPDDSTITGPPAKPEDPTGNVRLIDRPDFPEGWVMPSREEIHERNPDPRTYRGFPLDYEDE
jgi:hypothetical protein